MTYETLHTAVEDGILTLTLHRPDRLNAFTVTMANELVDAFSRASEDDGVRAVIVTGAGKAFCAGMDLGVEGNVFGLSATARPTLTDLDQRFEAPDIVDGVRDTGGRVSLAIFACKKPVIAAINGAAVGVGATMTLPMDIRLASDKARFGFVFGKLAIVPEACSTWFLPRVVGVSQALEWAYDAEVFDAQEALRGGLVKAVLPPDELLPEAKRIARRITEHRSPVAIALTRQMLYRNAAAPSPVEAHKIESLAVYYQSLGDAAEGVRAFQEKRPPEFKSTCSRDMPPFYPWWS